MTSVAVPTMLVHVSLAEIYPVEEMRSLNLPVELHRDLPAALAARRYPVVMVPALNERHLEFITAMARDHPLTAVVAVVSDLTGQRTQLAMNAGASWVLNTAVHREHSFNAIRPLIRLHLGPSPEAAVSELHRPADPGGVPGVGGLGALNPQPAGSTQPADGAGHLPPSRGEDCGDAREQAKPDQKVDAELVRMLCEDHRTTDIARRFYCSERSMYRRIRQVYKQFGVTTRQELRRLQATTAPSAKTQRVS